MKTLLCRCSVSIILSGRNHQVRDMPRSVQGLLSQGGAKLSAFQPYCTAENTQLSPYLTRRPGMRKNRKQWAKMASAFDCGAGLCESHITLVLAACLFHAIPAPYIKTFKYSVMTVTLIKMSNLCQNTGLPFLLNSVINHCTQFALNSVIHH